jgi:hypothetical protein
MWHLTVDSERRQGFQLRETDAQLGAWALSLVYLHTGWTVTKAGLSRTEEALALAAATWLHDGNSARPALGNGSFSLGPESSDGTRRWLPVSVVTCECRDGNRWLGAMLAASSRRGGTAAAQRRRLPGFGQRDKQGGRQR